jgi:hypothetical protein
MAVKKLVYWLIPLIVLILVFGWQSDAFAGVRAVVEGVIGLAPNVTIGAEELEGGEPTIIEEGGEEAINNLTKTIQKMLDSSEKNCFVNYGGLPEFAEKGTSIQFVYDGEKTKITVYTLGGKHVKERKEIPKMMPCVIAGNNEITENFLIIL